MRSKFLLVTSVIAAVAFVAWLVWVTPGSPPLTPGPSSATAPSAAPGPAAVASGFAGTAAGTEPPSPPAGAEAAQPPTTTPLAAPPEVLEATDRRQSAKITRGMASNPGGGIRIEAVPPGSVAGQMHLLPGDVLMTVDGASVASPDDFARIYRSGGVLGEFVVIRDGREIHRR